MTFKVYGIPVRDWIEMTIKASASLLEFAKTTVSPVLQNKKNRSHFEAALTTIYNRMFLWLEDSVVAKEAIRIQIASTCARSMFEHLIDLKWLTLTPQSAEAFLSFTVVRRFDMADKILKESLRNPYMDVRPLRAAIALATRPKSRTMRDNLCRQHGWLKKNGQPRTPRHWWGENSEQRALAVDPRGRKYIALHIALYSEFSNQIHPGGVGLQNISAEGVASLFIAAHQFTQQFFREATDLVCQHFPMPSEVTAGFRDKFSDDAIWGTHHHREPA
jgi:hypothetical protein